MKKQNLYRAVDTQSFPIRFLHLSGEFLTTNKKYSWLGNPQQFDNICAKYEWDGLSLVNDNVLS